jgi:hypothetical protein
LLATKLLEEGHLDRTSREKQLLFLVLALVIAAASANAQPDARKTLRGRVVDGPSLEGIPGATVEAASARTVTGEDGEFSLKLPPGTWVMTISALDYLEQTVSVVIANVSLRELEVSLFQMTEFSETVEVRALQPRQLGLSAESVEPQEVMRVAGSLDNIFRTVQTLPGVAATEDFGSRLSVRGGEPDQNLTIMDGVEISNPYRLFGLTSAFNPETVDHFELTAGGFSAKYGDRLSSILIVENRAGTSEKLFTGSMAASITDANLILEGRLPNNTRGSWLVTARRSYYDLVAGRIVDENLPSFADFQAKLNVEIGTNSTLSVFGLHSREDTDLNIEDENNREEFGNVVNDAGNDLVSVSFDSTIGLRANSRTIFSWYRNQDFLDVNGNVRNKSKRSNAAGDEALGFSRIIFESHLSVEDVALRQEFSFLVGGNHFLETGVECHRLETALSFEAHGDRNTSEANGSSIRGGVGLPDSLDSVLPSNRVGAWVQDQFVIGPKWTLEPGLRFDWSEANRRGTVSPRLAALFRINPSTRLKGASGLYTQSPGYEKLIQSDFFIDLTDASALELEHQRSTHFIVGFERDLSPGVTARVEGFYKTYNNLIVGRLETEQERLERVSRYNFPFELRGSIPTAPIITSNPSNDAHGNAYGFDVYLSKAATSRESRLAGWLSYTWSRGNRDVYARSYAFDYDRRHSLNLVGSYRLTPKWTLALTARIASGFPYTPPLGVRVAAMEDPEDPERLIPERGAQGLLVYESDFGDTNNLNAGRVPFYARFDMRMSWRPGGDTGNFELYCEVINALNRDNPISLEPRLEYDPDSDVPSIIETPTEGFPFLPSFGIRWRF